MGRAYVLGAVLALTAIASSAATSPVPPSLHPRAYCALAKDGGLPARAPYSEASGSCTSERVRVTATPGPNGLHNVVFYSVLGAADNPRLLGRLSLVLNVNNTKEATAATKQYAKHVEQLVTRLVGTAIPADLVSAAQQGRPKTWQLDGWRIELAREDFDNKNGYTLFVRLAPSA